MTQEEKKLLLKDLCARLPYGVKIYFGGIPKLLTSITIKTGYIEILVEGEYGKAAYCDFISTYNNTEYLQEEITEKCKPYLRPMSSMTEEEEEEYYQIRKRNSDKSLSLMDCSDHLQQLLFPIIARTESIDWLNAHHFDYRNLIGKGLALEAPEGIYKK